MAYNQPPNYDPYDQYNGQQPQYVGQAFIGQQPRAAPGYGAPQGPYQPPGYGGPPPGPMYAGAAPVYGQPAPAYGQPGPAPVYGAPQYTPAGANVPINKLPPSDAPVHSEGEKFVEQTQYRDKLWAILFLVHLLAVFILMLVMYSKYHKDLSADKDSETQDPNAVRVQIGGKFWGLLFLFLIGGAAMAATWMWVIQRYARVLIWFTLILGAAAQFFFAIVLFATGVPGGGVVFLIFALLNCVYIYFVRNRIAFSTVMLQLVAAVIVRYKAMVYYSLLGALAQGVWLIIWVLAAASTLYALDAGNASDGARGFCWFFLLVSFYWTSQVVSNVIHVGCAGTLATWYFLFPNNMPENPTAKAMKRSVTTSFGSICLGSLIIAVIKAIRALIQQARRSNNDFARACAECLITCIDNLVQFFNMYAFTQVAIYGKTYCEAAKATWDLLKSRGFDAIINDNLISPVLALGAFLGGCVVAGAGAILAKYIFAVGSVWPFYAVVGFFVGLAMTLCAMEVVESCVAALFVCFAEDPRALADSKPETYSALTEAFRGYYPNAMPSEV